MKPKERRALERLAEAKKPLMLWQICPGRTHNVLPKLVVDLQYAECTDPWTTGAAHFTITQAGRDALAAS